MKDDSVTRVVAIQAMVRPMGLVAMVCAVVTPEVIQAISASTPERSERRPFGMTGC